MQKIKKLAIYAIIITIAFLCLPIFKSSQSVHTPALTNDNTAELPPVAKAIKQHQTKPTRVIPSVLEPANYTSQKPKKQVLTLHESKGSHSSLSFKLPSFSVKKVSTPSGHNYTQIISSLGAKNLNQKGYPTLPRYKQQLLVPKNCPIELVIKNALYTTHTIGTLLPGSGPIVRTQERPEVECGDFYDSTDRYPKAPIFISSSFSFRNMRAITITINPFIFDAANQELLVYDQLSFQIKTPGGKLLLENPPIIADFQTRAANEFINYSQATAEYTTVTTRALPEPELGHILIIYANQFKDSLADFVLWKKKIGFNVETAEYPAETGTGVQSLKTFIDAKTAVSHIILIGDAADIPARVYNWDFTDFTDNYGPEDSFSSPSTKTHYTDRYYAGVEPSINSAASDLIADKFISRISSSDISAVEKQLTRIIDYESGKNLSTTSQWLETVLLVASKDGKFSSPFNQADYEHFNEIANTLIPNSHYTQTVKLYAEDGNPATPLATKDGVVQELELGKGLTYYLGHGYAYKWVTSTFDSTAAKSLNMTNNPSLFIQPVCNNGLFYSTTQCLAENQMEGEGAIGVLASPSETFWNPPILLLKSMTDSIIDDQFQTVGGILSSAIADAVLWSTKNENSFEDKATAIQLLYFGDCSMAMRTMTPKAMVLLTPQTFEKVAQSFQVSATAGSSISLRHDDTLIDTTTTDQEGNATLQLNGSNFERYTISGWKRNSLLIEENIISDTFQIELSTPNDNFEALINLKALFNGTVSLAEGSKFEIINGQLRYKESATRASEESIILQWTNESGDSEQITLKLNLSETIESTHSLNLKSGWNLVGSPVDSIEPLPSTTVATRSAPPTNLRVYNWDQAREVYYRPGENEKLESQRAFWVFAENEATSEPFKGVSPKGLMIGLALGWNLYSPVNEMPIPLGALSVWEWNVSSKNYTQISATKRLIPLTGYWIFMNP